eukprot:7361938-Alexandrium_andersonii.AAC.1
MTKPTVASRPQPLPALVLPPRVPGPCLPRSWSLRPSWAPSRRVSTRWFSGASDRGPAGRGWHTSPSKRAGSTGPARGPPAGPQTRRPRE